MRNFTIFLAIIGTIFSGAMLAWEIKNPTPKKEIAFLKPSVAPSSILGSTSLATPASPEQIIKDFYAWYLDCEDRNNCKWQENKHVSAKLIKSLAKQKDTRYDPIVCGKDMPKEVRISKTDLENGNATITFVFKNTIERTSDIELIIEENEEDTEKGERYKITDIICSS